MAENRDDRYVRTRNDLGRNLKTASVVHAKPRNKEAATHVEEVYDRPHEEKWQEQEVTHGAKRDPKVGILQFQSDVAFVCFRILVPMKQHKEDQRHLLSMAEDTAASENEEEAIEFATYVESDDDDEDPFFMPEHNKKSSTLSFSRLNRV
ncbi:hypothetical protein EC973_007849 [Apophysomyces ossiformis]|uniref:Uncharacterized protein n=1 Tax=Apophysomyces ossiformis TaxID=679940 RepID=A0A8H7EQ70_9FUNG|nr:hypothetical protein EC973_007849 [Apophysomyces ossiformis]